MNRPSLRLLAAGAMLLAAAAPQLAHAQYSWLDAKGTRVFSDRPPPPGTPPGRILTAPHRGAASDTPAPAAAAAPAAPAAPAADAAGTNKQPTLADRDADFRKRLAQRQADEKTARDEAAKLQAQREACDAARQEQAQLASGMRISEVDAKGERGYMSDEDRARRLARAREALAGCH